MQKIKSVSPEKAMRGSKAFGRHFCGSGKHFRLVQLSHRKNLAVVCNSFHLNTKVMLYCDAKMNVISDVLRDREGRLSKTTTNF